MILNFLKTFKNAKNKRIPTNFEDKIKKGIKLHTIRVDEKKRWRKGMKIHFSTGSRTLKYNCFKEGVCESVQKIAISSHFVSIDDRMLEYDEVEWLAINDGFDCIEDFWAWFDQYEPFVGRIIHWTYLIY